MTTPAPLQGLPPEKAEEGQSNKCVGPLHWALLMGIDTQVGG